VLVVGAPAFRQSPYTPGAFTEPRTRIAVVGDVPEEVHRSAGDLAVLASPAAVCRALAELVPVRDGPAPEPFTPPPPPDPRGAGESLLASHVLSALAERLPDDAVVVEEAPVDRPEIHERLLARRPLGFVSAAMGGLGFALPAATGIRMARPDRPVVAVVGDGSSIYGIQALWSAAHYGVGALFVVLANGGYAVMDLLAKGVGGRPPWPAFDVHVEGLAHAFGCPARRIEDAGELERMLDEVVPGLAERAEPLLLEVVVAPDPTFAP